MALYGLRNSGPRLINTFDASCDISDYETLTNKQSGIVQQLRKEGIGVKTYKSEGELIVEFSKLFLTLENLTKSLQNHGIEMR